MQSRTVSCKSKDAICTWFQVGFLPVLKFNDYDIVVELLGTDTLKPQELWNDVNFRMVYINENWTEA